jgi:hypothetical protein
MDAESIPAAGAPQRGQVDVAGLAQSKNECSSQPWGENVT